MDAYIKGRGSNKLQFSSLHWRARWDIN